MKNTADVHSSDLIREARDGDRETLSYLIDRYHRRASAFRQLVASSAVSDDNQNHKGPPHGWASI